MEPLRNGQCNTNTGYKQVAIDSTTFQVRPVLYGVFSGYRVDRTTYQVQDENDFILNVAWGRKTEDFTVFQGWGNSAKLLSQTESMIVWDKAVSITPWIDEYLKRSPRGESMLPIPEEFWISFINKKKAAEKFAKTYGDILPDVMKDRKEDLKFNPRPMDIDTTKYIPQAYHWVGSCVDIHRYEEFFASNGQGSSLQLSIQSNFESGSNYAHVDTIKHEGEPIAECIPEGYKYLIRIKHGIFTSNGSTHGHSVDVWQMEGV